MRLRKGTTLTKTYLIIFFMFQAIIYAPLLLKNKINEDNLFYLWLVHLFSTFSHAYKPGVRVKGVRDKCTIFNNSKKKFVIKIRSL